MKRQEKKKEWEGRIIPKGLIIARYFAAEQKAIENLEADRDAIARQMEEMEEEHGGEEGFMADAKNDKDKINKASVQKRLKEIQDDKEAADERKVLQNYLKLAEQEAESGKKIKEAHGRSGEKGIGQIQSPYRSRDKNLGGRRQMDGYA